MRMTRSVLATMGLGLLLLAGACSDDDPTGPDEATYRDLQVNLMSMDPHLDQLIGFRVLDDSDVLLGAGIIDSLRSTDISIMFPDLLPEAAARLDFWADLSGNRTYDAPPTDHAWRESLAASGTVTVDFTHNTAFTDISQPAYASMGDFTLNLLDMTPHVGQLIELRVVESATGRTVGYYRVSELDEAAHSLTVPGIIENGTAYRVDLYADLNQNGMYDAPSTDHAWRLTGTGGAAGLTMDFTHNTDFTDIGW